MSLEREQRIYGYMTRQAQVEVAEERIHQDAKWGGPEHDDDHTMLDWSDYIREREQRVRQGDPDTRQLLIEIAALAVAAIESWDRQDGPTYDGTDG